MRRLGALLVLVSACSLEHPISRVDAAAGADLAANDLPAVDAPEPIDAPDVVEPVDAPDVVTSQDVPDAVAPSDALDVTDAPEPPDALDAAMPDVIDAAMPDVIDAAMPADRPDVVEAMDRPDVVEPVDRPDVVIEPMDRPDVVEPVDIIDAGAPDIVDVPGVDIVDVPARPDVPVGPDVPTYAYTLVTGDVQTTDRQGNSNGTDRVLRCEAGEVLVGLSIRASMYVSGFASRCAALRTNGTLGPTRETSYQGGTSFGSRTNDDCPAGSIVVGLVGKAGGIVDRVAVQCASLASWIPGRTLTATLPARGGGGGSDFTVQCPVGFVGLGVEFDTTFYSLDFRASRLRLACVRVSRQPP